MSLLSAQLGAKKGEADTMTSEDIERMKILDRVTIDGEVYVVVPADVVDKIHEYWNNSKKGEVEI